MLHTISLTSMFFNPGVTKYYLGCIAMSFSNCVGFLPNPASIMASSFSPEVWQVQWSDLPLAVCSTLQSFLCWGQSSFCNRLITHKIGNMVL